MLQIHAEITLLHTNSRAPRFFHCVFPRSLQFSPYAIAHAACLIADSPPCAPSKGICRRDVDHLLQPALLWDQRTQPHGCRNHCDKETCRRGRPESFPHFDTTVCCFFHRDGWVWV